MRTQGWLEFHALFFSREYDALITGTRKMGKLLFLRGDILPGGRKIVWKISFLFFSLALARSCEKFQYFFSTLSRTWRRSDVFFTYWLLSRGAGKFFSAKQCVCTFYFLQNCSRFIWFLIIFFILQYVEWECIFYYCAMMRKKVDWISFN